MRYYPFYHQSECCANYAIAPSQSPHETDNRALPRVTLIAIADSILAISLGRLLIFMQ